MKKLRNYQIENAKKAIEILSSKKIVYLCMEVRTGKTATAFETAKNFGAKKVLFLTKKKAIDSVLEDYNQFGYDNSFDMVVKNDESMHTITDNAFDLVIHDEHHRFGAFPKPGKATQMFKAKYGHLPMIFLSGTPTPESKMQWFHQFWVSNYSPLSKSNFYSFYKSFGFKAYQFDLGFGMVNNYSASEEIIFKYYALKKRNISKEHYSYDILIEDISRQQKEDIKFLNDALVRLDNAVKDYLVTYTQKEAGFTSEIKEKILTVKMSKSTQNISNRLIKDRLINGKEEVILADTAVKLQSKLHQVHSGTVKFESGNTMVIDDSKGVFIKDYFKGKKIGIFYKFKAEFDLLKSVFKDELTNDISEFNDTPKNIALQIVSGREGISLRKADYLIFFNIDFSATSYWQARDRLTTMDRLNNEVFWIFSEGGIEEKIYNTVVKKKDFTTSIFKKEYGI